LNNRDAYGIAKAENRFSFWNDLKAEIGSALQSGVLARSHPADAHAAPAGFNDGLLA
jgi:hypothetical protein